MKLGHLLLFLFILSVYSCKEEEEELPSVSECNHELELPGYLTSSVCMSNIKYTNAIQFVNSEIGFASADRNRLMKTVNGGELWETSITLDLPINSYFFVDASIGFISTSISYSNDQASLLLRTTNGGLTWDTLTLDHSVLRNLHFVDDNLGFGWAVQLENTQGFTLMKTTDSGRTWKATALRLDQYYAPPIQFIDQSIGYVGAFSGEILKTFDAGKNWAAFDTEVGANIVDLNFLDENIGIVLFHSHTAKTLDGGQTWEQIQFSENNERQGVFTHFKDKDNGYLVARKLELDFDVFYCTKTEIFTTIDGGRNWDLKESIEELCSVGFSRLNNETAVMSMQKFLFKIKAE